MDAAYTWYDFKAENLASMEEAAKQANAFWSDLSSNGEETSKQFVSMLKNIGNYR